MVEMFDARTMREGVSGSGHSSSLVMMPFAHQGQGAVSPITVQFGSRLIRLFDLPLS